MTIYYVITVLAVITVVVVCYKMYGNSMGPTRAPSTVTHPDPSMRNVNKKYTLKELAGYTGNGRILLSFCGDVYDVSAGERQYGKGGAYQMLSGKDASRSVGLNCFRDVCLLPDVRDMSADQTNEIKKWHTLLERSYPRVGFVDKAELVSTDAQIKAANDQVEAIRKLYAM